MTGRQIAISARLSERMRWRRQAKRPLCTGEAASRLEVDDFLLATGLDSEPLALLKVLRVATLF